MILNGLHDLNNYQLQPGQRIHIVGIGGSGMSAIAQLLLEIGYVVSGSDLKPNKLTAALAESGAEIFVGHEAAHVAGADIALVSSAIPKSNPELEAAGNAGIPILKRAQFLGKLMQNKVGIAVAGTHGKTTTTGMIAHILTHAGHDPSIIMGGIAPSLGSNGKAGAGDAFVVEADEYDYMFLGLRPKIGVITNIEHDHPDIFPTEAAYQQAFVDFTHLIPHDGALIVCSDDAGIQQALDQGRLPKENLTTYGIKNIGDNLPSIQALDLRPNPLGGTDFVVVASGETLGIVRLAIPGEHNVLNSLAAIAVSLRQGALFNDIVKAMPSFTGIGRRFELIGEANGVTVIDDYAHHPTEIKATLAAGRQRFAGRRIWAVWQPHTFSRSKLFLSEFVGSFQNADKLIVLNIYRSREKNDLALNSAKIAKKIKNPIAHHIASRREAASYLATEAKMGDVIITLGAGDGNAVGKWLLEKLGGKVGS